MTHPKLLHLQPPPPPSRGRTDHKKNVFRFKVLHEYDNRHKICLLEFCLFCSESEQIMPIIKLIHVLHHAHSQLFHIDTINENYDISHPWQITPPPLCGAPEDGNPFSYTTYSLCEYVVSMI